MCDKIIHAGRKPVRIRQDFHVNAGEQASIGTSNTLVSRCRNAPVVWQANEMYLRRLFCPPGKRNRIRRAIVNDNYFFNWVSLLHASSKGCLKGLGSLAI